MTAVTVSDTALGSSWFIKVWTGCTELVSSPYTPLTSECGPGFVNHILRS